ncbi:anti-sigma factor [Cohnella sp. REN36]|uniref:anti-sigma factor family protein n=1 Tax=Cohnella sp. REN36 TaxID=2887347 RepID=UPI001D154BE8|nr:zf-HC2 domain-containing protein [Cohnella sp. REN36]MCC3375657.1 zf-HC2 domain-containing protein [Cohnella sp. REN36]
MNCQEVMELMQRSVDGDLDERETARMMAHVQTCPECAAMLERLTRLSHELAQLPRVLPRYSLVDAILPQLEQLTPEPAPAPAEPSPAVQADEPEARPGRSFRPTRAPLYRRLAGVVALGVIAGLIVANQPFSWLSSTAKDNSAAPEMTSYSMSADTASGDGKQDEAAEAGAAESPSPDSQVPTRENRDIAKSVRPDATNKSSVLEQQTRSSGETSNQGKSASNPGAPAANGAAEPPKTEKGAPKSQDEQGFAPEATAPSIAGNGLAARDGFSLMANPLSEWASPDGELTAYTETGKGAISVAKTKDGSIVYRSDPRDGSITDVVWTEDGQQLQYTWTDSEGHAKRLKWDAATGKESERTDP